MIDEPVLEAAGSSHEAVELWEDGTGAWQWRYLDGEAGVDLRSNRGYETRGAALEAARLAYPHVAVFERDPNSSGVAEGGRILLPIAALVVVAASLLLAVVMTITGLAVLALAGRALARRVRTLLRR